MVNHARAVAYAVSGYARRGVELPLGLRSLVYQPGASATYGGEIGSLRDALIAAADAIHGQRLPWRDADRAAVRPDDPLHPLEVAREESLQRLRIYRLPQSRRTDHVAEKHRHHLPMRAPRHKSRLEH